MKYIFFFNFMAMSLFVCAFHVCESKGGLYVNVKLHFYSVKSILYEDSVLYDTYYHYVIIIVL